MKFQKGQPAWNKGLSNEWCKIPRTEEVKKKISEGHKRRTEPIKKTRVRVRVSIVCLNCGVHFDVVMSREDKAKCCSVKCISELKKGIIPYNKGVFTASSHGAYHDKVRKIRGTPSLCEVCKCTDAKKFEWANLTGLYEDINDYKRMCSSCHAKYDGKGKYPRKTTGITGISI